LTAIVVGVFLSSLLGSLHCAGMCGPLVAAYAGMPGTEAPWRRRAMAHAAYSAGRLAGYVALGACAGAFGAALDHAGAWAGVTRAAAIVSGVLIALWGLHAFLTARGVRVRRIEAPSFVRRTFGVAMRAMVERPPATRAALLGVGTALLPCGWLYAFVVTAAGTAGALTGALVMAVFWTGTLPVMLAFGETVRALSGPLRRHVPAACAVVLMVLGLLTVFGRAQLGPFAANGPAPAPPACHGTR
jgi:sulfite exporter TauE/SafE